MLEKSLKPFIYAGYAHVVELVDTPDLGSGAARRGGSSPSMRTMMNQISCGCFSAGGTQSSPTFIL